MALPGSLGNAADSALTYASGALASGLPAVRSFLEGTLADLLRQWRTDTRLYTLASASRTHPLPADLMVESFVLHDAVTDDGEGVYASTLSIPGGLEMTTSRDVLEAMSLGAGPRRVFVSLGYASWAKGQLESEITENAWLTVEADPAIIFEAPVDQRYERAMGLLGLQPWMLSRDAGHA